MTSALLTHGTHHFAAHSYNSPLHQITGWLARAAMWRMMGRLPFGVVIIVGLAAIGVWFLTSRSASRRRV